MSISDAEREIWFDSAITGNVEKLEELLDTNADFINLETPNGETALIWAAQNGNTDLIQMLLERGAFIDQQDNDGNTALIICSFRGMVKAVELLLQYKPNTGITDVFGKYALDYAIETGHDEIRRLIEEYIDKQNVDNQINYDNSLDDGNNNIDEKIDNDQIDEKTSDHNFEEGILGALKNAGPWKALLMAIYNPVNVKYD